MSCAARHRRSRKVEGAAREVGYDLYDAPGVAFLVVGGMKSRFVDQSWWRSALETLTVGGLAATLAYAAGAILQSIA